ncbi:hypothetical protein FHU38_002856 [Saccharomonospora amisosensis]|uniref:Uncharacterized protein n=1 Tax=Saccharomonospora amisosensis TaxID=1128677 RepID=A0A7X5UQT8_9PSEU|nr:hypothetical protein [Saccharomonospora amisosensis]NIJ12512.1 hypothetical protein [Saccharomonospora amisosensis]
MRSRTDIRLATAVAALASAGAALIHLAVIPGHWREWALSGLFFGGLAVFQLGWAAAVLRRPSRAVVAVGVAANLGAIGLWVLTRAVGLPFGPHAGEAEAAGTADILATLLECVVLVTGAWRLLSGEHGSRFSPLPYRLVIGGAAVLVAVTAAPGMLAGLSHSHEGGGGSHDEGGEHPETGAEHDHPSTPPEQPEQPDGSGPQRTDPPSGEPAPDRHSEGEPHGH